MNKSVMLNNIQKAALIKFKEFGYNKTTLSAIADEAQLKRSALKKSFKSKKEIFRSLFEDEKQFVLDELSGRLSGIDCSSTEKVSAGLQELFFFIRENEFLSMVYKFGDFPVEYCLQDDNLNSHDPLAGQSSLLEKFILDCQKADVMRQGNSSVLTIVVRSIFHFLLIERAKLPNELYDRKFVEIFVDGLLSVNSNASK